MQPSHLPKHVAIIPDGNRRWARERGRPGFEGHIEGVKRFREISRAAFEMGGIRYFTFWAASFDNLTKRSPEEVAGLVSLLKQELADESTLQMCCENEVHFRTSGEWDEILQDNELLGLVTNLDRRTLHFKKHHLTLRFGYSGKREMLGAVRELCYHAVEKWRSSPNEVVGRELEDIDEALIRKFLRPGDLPPLDLVIRTGACEEGPNWSHYSSGFMMWLAADAKVFSPSTLWPDFTAEMFRQTIADYSKTLRRFGA